MRKTKSETMAYKKQNNLTFNQKLDGCMLQKMEDFIIDEKRRNTEPVKIKGDDQETEEFKSAITDQRITGN